MVEGAAFEWGRVCGEAYLRVVSGAVAWEGECACTHSSPTRGSHLDIAPSRMTSHSTSHSGPGSAPSARTQSASKRLSNSTVGAGGTAVAHGKGDQVLLHLFAW